MTDQHREYRQVELPTGTISVDVHASLMPLDSLCGFAARQNPKRGFLFVSNVLGKHRPVKPSVVRDVHDVIASQIPADLPGPVVIVGMAETATCLGQGVFEAYKRLTDREDVVFIQSTRYLLNKPKALEFLEEHCHAADHIMYQPEDPRARLFFSRARSLVLVDDEASTGKTFVNLGRAFKEVIGSLERIVTAVITDWRGPARTAQTLANMPVPASTVSVLSGEYGFTASPSLKLVEMPKVTGNGAPKDSLLPVNHGRLGTDSHFQLSPQVRAQAAELVARANGGRILVLGTGEFSFPPFHLALAMEEMGADVVFQTTTRSPIMQGHAIEHVLKFRDNYEDDIVNFVYNVAPGQYDLVVIAHETPEATIDSDLKEPLGAYCVRI